MVTPPCFTEGPGTIIEAFSHSTICQEPQGKSTGVIMNVEPEEPMREYIGFIRITGQPDIPLRLMASSSGAARKAVIEQYGTGHIISVWNEEDASQPR
ncbi:hypothetical protein ACIPW5_06915 [Streptomyces sp. NPDC090077]|uniref:hypothetical protein n=1 Tax=Streptomyces sp. NPDC090077 TaxID=3365938 RepID=UPI003824D88E